MTEKMNNEVTITDVTLREYGQNIPAKDLDIFNPAIRIKIALKLIEAGFSNIEILSCIHPRIAPAMEKKALKEIVEGNEIFKKEHEAYASAFKAAHKDQSPQTRQIVTEMKA